MPKLPLTLFEEYLFHENRRNYPCNIWLKAQFKGSVERDRLIAAIDTVTPRHPLLSARVLKTWDGALFWSTQPTRKIDVHWYVEDPRSFTPQFGDFDLESENGFEFHVVQGEDRWDFYINQSHAVCDGAGFYRVLHDVLIRYDELSRNQTGTQSSSNLAPSRFRSNYGLSFWKVLKLIPAQIVGLIISATLLRRSVATLNPASTVNTETPLPAGSPHIVSKYLNRSEYFKFRKTARESKYSVNDLCLAFFHSAIGRWREKMAIPSGDEWIRISVPINLRTKADKSLSACNAISIVSIDRKANGLHKRNRLIRRAKEDMQYVKKGQLALIYLVLLWIRRRLPGGIRKMSNETRCRTTTMLTNVGSLFTHSPLRNKEGKLETKGAVMERITSAAPYRPHSHATLLLSVYAGEFEMTLHYDPRAIDEAQAQSLLDCFEEEIRKGI